MAELVYIKQKDGQTAIKQVITVFMDGMKDSVKNLSEKTRPELASEMCLRIYGEQSAKYSLELARDPSIYSSLFLSF
tara:strand:- start:38 stop:268 length:231 start_codon:yes stop_codon:yes gene_type:complete